MTSADFPFIYFSIITKDQKFTKPCSKIHFCHCSKIICQLSFREVICAGFHGFTGKQRTTMEKIAVIGAGIAGLVCADHLSRKGMEVSVFERSPQIGGRAQTVKENGFTIDLGAQFFFSNYHRTRDLVDRLYLKSSTVRINDPFAFLRHGRVYPFSPYFLKVNPGSFWLLGFDALDWRQRASLSRLIFWLGTGGRSVGVESRDGGYAFDGIDLRSFFEERFGATLYRDFVSPLVQTVSFQEPTHLSAMTGILRLRGAMKGLWSTMGGAGYLATNLRREIKRVLPRHAVVGIEPDGDSMVIRFEDDREPQRFDRVIVATDAEHARTLLAQNGGEGIPTLPYQPAVVVNQALDSRPEKIRNRFAIIPHPMEARPFRFVINSYSRFVGSVPPGCTCLQWFLTGDQALAAAEKSDAELIDLIEHQAHGMFPDMRKPLFNKVVRWQRAVVQQKPGHLAIIKSLPKKIGDRIYLAGSYMRGGGIEAAVISGKDAALSVLDDLTAGR